MDTNMAKTIEKGIIFVRTTDSIDEPSLGSNEYRVTDYCKLRYEGLPHSKPSKREMTAYRDILNHLDSVFDGMGDISVSFERLSKI